MIDLFRYTPLNVALHFAIDAHAGQSRKYTGGLPYMIHPLAVTRILMGVCDDHEMLRAALLHDTVEDCEVAVAEIGDRFGFRVASLVDDMTDKTSKETHPHLNRQERRHLDHKRLSRIHPDAKTIKLADVIHNTSMIEIVPQKFADLYMAEKRQLLPVLAEGDPVLFETANCIVAEYFSS